MRRAAGHGVSRSGEVMDEEVQALDYVQMIERRDEGWVIVGAPETYATLQEAWDEARHDILHAGGGRIAVIDSRGRVRASQAVTIRDLGHSR